MHTELDASGSLEGDMSFNPMLVLEVQEVERAFRAEVRRSWFTFRDSLSATKTDGKLWLPASIMFEEGRVRVSTSEGEMVLRPRRLAWAGPGKLLVSGLGSDGHVRRSILRFTTTDEANEAVSKFKNLGILGLEPVSQGEEIRCLVRIAVPKELLWVIAALFLPYLILLGFFLIVGAVPYVGPVLLVVTIAFVLSRRFWLFRLVERMLKSRTPLFFRTVKGSLKVEEQRLVLKPYYYPGSMLPTLIQWRSPSIFLLKIERTEFELTFSTSEDAAKAVVLVKTNFPQVQETWTINS
ncbi:hypothetical protein AUG19_01225 [archaeon 13_1_20CM_2_54_9]|nr:MAG: hypothetical protein AUG19_01225 [archaeon 13_1_20CM_2_54_9]